MDKLITVNFDPTGDPILRALRRLAVDLYGSMAPQDMERVFYAVIDLTVAVRRRHLRAGTLTDGILPGLQSAVAALLTADRELQGVGA